MWNRAAAALMQRSPRKVEAAKADAKLTIRQQGIHFEQILLSVDWSLSKKHDNDQQHTSVARAPRCAMTRVLFSCWRKSRRSPQDKGPMRERNEGGGNQARSKAAKREKRERQNQASAARRIHAAR